MKYKELPAFESNEFKVGDLINIYSPEPLQINRISKIYQDLIIVENSLSGCCMFHFKQCRKLVPIEAREWEVWIDCYGDLFDNPKDLYYDKKAKKIKVREVLEDEWKK